MYNIYIPIYVIKILKHFCRVRKNIVLFIATDLLFIRLTEKEKEYCKHII